MNVKKIIGYLILTAAVIKLLMSIVFLLFSSYSDEYVHSLKGILFGIVLLIVGFYLAKPRRGKEDRRKKQEQPAYIPGRKSKSGRPTGFSRPEWLGNIPYGCRFVQETKWVKIVVAACCLSITASFFLPWFGRLRLYELITDIKAGIVFPLWAIGPRVFGATLIFSVIFIGYLIFLKPADTWPVPGRVLLGIPLVLTISFFISCFASASALSDHPMNNLRIGLRLSLLFSLILVIIGIMNDMASGDDKIERHNKTLKRRVSKVLYYLFIWTGLLFACLEWRSQQPIELSHWQGRLWYNWPYLSAAVVFWLLFSRYQFIRIWFHLISFYALLLYIINIMIWESGAGFLFNLVPFIVCCCLYTSLSVGRKRSCPSCNILYGKEVLSYEKDGETTNEKKEYQHYSVGNYRAMYGNDHNTMYRANYDTITVERRSSRTWYHYKTFNRCKKCGREWESRASFDAWWVRPV